MFVLGEYHGFPGAFRPGIHPFRFPYTDTLKILQKWGSGAHFFGNGLDEDIDTLEALLVSESKLDPSKPPILALFTEFPSNPLLRSANLPRLRALADKYDFLIVIDETIGNFVNVDVLPYADIVVSSLTKVFSGASNVMGGRFVFPSALFQFANAIPTSPALCLTRKADTTPYLNHNSLKHLKTPTLAKIQSTWNGTLVISNTASKSSTTTLPPSATFSVPGPQPAGQLLHKRPSRTSITLNTSH